jgi:YHS domain-containing protein
MLTLSPHRLIPALAFVTALALAPGFLARRALARDAETFPYDPVELVSGKERAGSESHVVVRGRYRYLLANEENARIFRSDPARYEIQMGGGCGRMGPLSGRGRTDLFAVHDGHLYIFASEGCRKGFLSAPEKLIETDDSAPVVDDPALAEGKRLLAVVLRGLGGEKSVSSLRRYRQDVEKSVENEGETIRTAKIASVDLSGAYRWDDVWGDLTWSMVSGPAGSFFLDSDGKEPMSACQEKALRARCRVNALVVLREALDRDDALVFFSGGGSIGTTATRELTIHLDGSTYRLSIDPDSGRVLRMETRGRGPRMSFGNLAYLYSDFREVENLVLPFAIDVEFEGEAAPSQGFRITSIRLDEDVAEALFRG